MKSFRVFLVAIAFCGIANGQDGGTGKVVVRLTDPAGTHCIDGSKENVSLFLKRIWTEKTSGLFT